MVTNRFITLEDYDILAQSLKMDEHHSETPPEFFYEEGTVCSVYEDEDGLVLFVRGQAFDFSELLFIRLDIQFLSNSDRKRNIKTMLTGFQELKQKAIDNGFNAIVFEPSDDRLKNFCIKYLGFKEYNGILACEL